MNSLVFALILLGAAAPMPDQDKKSAIPDQAAIEDAEQTIRELFKEDYAKKGAVDKRAFAVVAHLS